MLVVDHANHGRRVDLVRAIERDAVLHRRAELLEPVERVRERRPGGMHAAAGRLVVPRRAVRGAARQQARVGVQGRLVRGRLERRQDLALVVRGVLEETERPRGARRHHRAVEGPERTVSGPELDAGTGAAQRGHRCRQLHRRSEAVEQRPSRRRGSRR